MKTIKCGACGKQVEISKSGFAKSHLRGAQKCMWIGVSEKAMKSFNAMIVDSEKDAIALAEKYKGKKLCKRKN